jgi:hypothetical protein
MVGRRNNNRAGGRGTRNRGAVTRRELNALKHEITGCPVVPQNNANAYIQRPWNSWVFQRTDNTTANFEAVPITIGSIIDQIRGRCNINTVGSGDIGNQISLRIQMAQCWVTASGLIFPDMEVTFFELNPNDANQQIRYTKRDVGTLNIPAKCGYRYPMNDSKEVLSDADSTLNVVSTTPSAIGSQVTHRINVLWRSSR